MLNKFLSFIATIGRFTIGFFRASGDLILFTTNVIRYIFKLPFYIHETIRMSLEIGFYSLPVVALTTIFSGMVIAIQTYEAVSKWSAESAVSWVVLIAVTRELAPVMAALMVAGRVGAAMAAEIGTMRVTEQIDALSTLHTNPVQYLIVPRVVAGTLMMPLLVLLGDIIGICGGYLVGVTKMDFNATTYLVNTWNVLKAMDIISGMTKAAVFGFIITVLGCYHGFKSQGGAQGVGQATTNAVVSSSILILIFNYLLTELFFKM